MAYEFVIYEKDGPLAKITLNRPERLNPLSNRLRDDLDHALADADAEADDDIHVIIIKGSGRAFSSGYDLIAHDFSPKNGAIQEQVDLIRKSGQRWMQTIWNLRKPVIAQVHGFCMAGGNDLAGICDLTFAAEDAIFSVNEARALGINHLFGLWPLLLGIQKTKELFFTGGFITGKEAEELGLVNRAFPADKLEEEAFARKMSMLPVDLLHAHKHAINRWYEIMGIDAMVKSTGEWDVLAANNPNRQKWMEILQEKGLGAAIDWRDSPFQDGFKRQKKS
ncbi:MAG: enoyl-CoA hydratase/isomerase family protein [Chloroflexi bacterium]|nr:enoyl-CoA hydratase/isomerase family protein [Chloroflexota bacterium]